MLQFNEYSNHSPLTFTVKTFENDVRETTREWQSLHWTDEHKDIFRDRLHVNMSTFEEDISSLNIDTCTQECINELTGNFTNRINSAAGNLFTKTHKPNAIPRFSEMSKPRQDRAIWYDDECKAKKSLLKSTIRAYNLENSTETREAVFKARKDYKYFCRKKKLKFQRDRCLKMNEIRRTQPRKFWKLFKQKRNSPKNDISLDQFFDHFKNLASSDIENEEEDVETFLRNFDADYQNESTSRFEELDRRITQEEIKRSIKNLSRSKSPGGDNLLNEYFIEGMDVLLKPFELLFNVILDSGCFPSQWTEGTIIPLYKKGAQDATNNYRGITLISCLGKLFTSVINQRLIEWSTANDISTDAQFGFKPDHSTVDAIFVLQNIIEMYLSKKQRLYCAFIDLKRAFDTVYRNGLWYELIKYGVDGKIIRLLRSMYSSVKSCVRHLNCLSDFFKSDLGLFQGEIMSPILFSLFINDIESSLQVNTLEGITLDQITIYLLLFADDAVIISDSKEGLQSSLSQLESYCKKWKLTVNVSKTKVVIFQKGGRFPHDTFYFQWRRARNSKRV